MPDPLTGQPISTESILSALAVGAAWAIREWRQKIKASADSDTVEVPQRPRVAAVIQEAHREREQNELTILSELRGIRSSLSAVEDKVDDLWRLRDQEGVPTSHRSKALNEALASIQQTMVAVVASQERVISAVKRTRNAD